jgi:hypothetical protein
MEWSMPHAKRKQKRRLHESTVHVLRGQGEGRVKNLENSLVSNTRPGYTTFSRSFSAEIPSTLFSPTEVAIAWTGPEGGVYGAPSRLDKETGVGLGSTAGHVPGDTGLVRVSICGHDVSNKRYTINWPDLGL